MRDIDIPAFRKEAMGIVNANLDKTASLEAADDYSIFTFCGKNYVCEVTLNDKWIGYDMAVETPDSLVGCGLEEGTDSYALKDGNERVTLQVFDSLLTTLKALFDGKVYYTANEKFSYIARDNGNGTYMVRYSERKRFLFWDMNSGWWKDDYSKVEFEKLKLTVLS